MGKFIFSISLIFLLSSCNHRTVYYLYIPVKERTVPASKLEIDIPQYENGKYFGFWNLTKQKEEQLHLRPMEQGSKDLEIRIWFTHQPDLEQPSEMIRIYKKDNEWQAIYYQMMVFYNPSRNKETIEYKKEYTVNPKCGWDTFFEIVHENNLLNLPTIEKIPKYLELNDNQFDYENNLTTYSIETATDKKYRFYQYNSIQKYKEIEEVGQFSTILQTINREFELEEIRRKNINPRSFYFDPLEWKNKKLKISDFEAPPIVNEDFKSESDVEIRWRSFRRQNNKIEYSYLKTTAYFNKYNSFIHSKYLDNKYVLAYNQTVFDLTELYARYVQESLIEVPRRTTPSQKAQPLIDELQKSIKDFTAISNYGLDSTTLFYWQDSIQQLLENTPRVLPKTYFPLNKYGFGMSFGVGYSQFNGTVSDYFTNPIEFNFSGSYFYKNILLSANMSIGSNRIKKELDENHFWEKDLETAFLTGNLLLGYRIQLNKRISIRPFCGVGLSLLTFRNKSDDQDLKDLYKDHKLFDQGLRAGFSVVYNLNSKTNISPFLKGKYYNKIGIKSMYRKLNFESSPDNLIGDNFQISLFFQINLIRFNTSKE